MILLVLGASTIEMRVLEASGGFMVQGEQPVAQHQQDKVLKYFVTSLSLAD